ncbi:MAG: NAD(+) kinase [Gammaproteobacteria bacterium]|nr:NAD(+) kinase [Gammaproteobacteria bacterium]
MAYIFNKIGLIGTHRNPLVAETVGLLLQLVESLGLSVWIEHDTAAALSAKPKQTCSIESLGDNCDLVIAVGGDGNLLHAARFLSVKNIPVLGINRGQLGFLTDIKPDDLEQPLHTILKGQFQEEKRFLLEAKAYHNDKLIGQGNALNDIVLFPGDIAQLIEFEMHINGKFVYSQRSDGLIVSTPTGSTAYALSAGGPIMGPELNVLVIVPKFPHTLTSRPLVIDADSEIVLHVGDYNKIGSRLSYDGQSHVNLSAGDKIVITKQKQPLRLIHPLSYDYYAVLRTKLQWGTQLIPISRT